MPGGLPCLQFELRTALARAPLGTGPAQPSAVIEHVLCVSGKNSVGNCGGRGDSYIQACDFVEALAATRPSHLSAAPFFLPPTVHGRLWCLQCRTGRECERLLP